MKPKTDSNTASPGPPTANDAEKAHDLRQLPLSWDEVVPGNRPVELEVGSGKGLFLRTAALQKPSHFFVGIELAVKFANRAAERLKKHNVPNARMLCGDAQAFLRDVVPDAVVDAVHVYFPDPWWRNKHKKRRVLNDQALSDIERILKAGGQLHFWTDVLDYYEVICGQIMKQTAFSGPHYVPERMAEHNMDYTTNFERRARLNSQPVYRAMFSKPA